MSKCFGKQIIKILPNVGQYLKYIHNIATGENNLGIIKFILNSLAMQEKVLKLSLDENVSKLSLDENVSKFLLNEYVLKYMCDNTCFGKFTVLHHPIVNGISEVHESVVWSGFYVDKLDVMKYLEDKGVAKNNDGSTLLEMACGFDKLDVIQYLVDNAVAVNAKTGFSKLHMANVLENSLKFMLKTFGIDVDLEENEKLFAELKESMKAILDGNDFKKLLPEVQELENEENDFIFDNLD